MEDLARRLASIPPSQWWLHEIVACKMLGLKAKEGLSTCTQLSNLLLSLTRGGTGGNSRTGSWEATGFPTMDLHSTDPNPLNIHYEYHGTKEGFATESLSDQECVFHRPRYFWFGKKKAINTKDQMLLLRQVTGDANVIDSVTAK